MENDNMFKNINIPEIETPKHQERLRSALMENILSEKNNNNYLSFIKMRNILFYLSVLCVLIIIILTLGIGILPEKNIDKNIADDKSQIAFIDKVIASDKEQSLAGDYLKIKMKVNMHYKGGESLMTVIEQVRNEKNNYWKDKVLEYNLSNPGNMYPLEPDNLDDNDLDSLRNGLNEEQIQTLEDTIGWYRDADPNSCGTGDGERTEISCFGKYYIQMIPGITYQGNLFDDIANIDTVLAEAGYKRVSLFELIKIRYLGANKVDNAIYNMFSTGGFGTDDIYNSIKELNLVEKEGKFEEINTIYFENDIAQSRKREVNFSKDDFSLVGIREYTKVDGIDTLEFDVKILEYQYFNEIENFESN